MSKKPGAVHAHKPRWEWNFGRKVAYPEKSSRVKFILQGLRKHGFGGDIIQAQTYSDRLIKKTHDPAMVRHIQSCRDMADGEVVWAHIFPYRAYDPNPKTDLRRAGYYCFDVGTMIDRHTYDAARSAVDVALHGAELLTAGKQRHVFGACRPPGHHADRGMYGGYCYFNNAAIAAHKLSRTFRVAILDLDFHHGNGTQSIFYDLPHIFFASLHGDPRRHYPYFSGFASERGNGLAKGANLNVPLPAGIDDAAYAVLLDRTLRRLKHWGAELLVVSMGFDTFHKDPAGDAELTTPFFGEIGHRLRRFGKPVLALLEGGYALKELGENVASFCTGLDHHD